MNSPPQQDATSISGSATGLNTAKAVATVEERDSNSSSSSVPFVIAGVVRALVLFVKKGAIKKAITAAVKKKAFVTIGRRTTRAAVHDGGKGMTGKPLQLSNAIATRENMAALGEKFIVNAFYGSGVFVTYEAIAYHRLFGYELRGNKTEAVADSSDHMDTCMGITQTNYDTPRTSIASHFAAGAFSGLTQSALMYAVESASPIIHQSIVGALNGNAGSKQTIRNCNFLLRRAVHHSLGYASLFGCFELVRRKLLAHFHKEIAFGTSCIPVIFDEMERMGLCRRPLQGGQHWKQSSNDVSPATLTAAFLAGGIAGQVHHAVSHYTSHWKFQALSPANTVCMTSKPTKKRRGMGDSLRRVANRMPKPPSFRSSIASFAPTALVFVVFQYGGLLTERVVDMQA